MHWVQGTGREGEVKKWDRDIETDTFKNPESLDSSESYSAQKWPSAPH